MSNAFRRLAILTALVIGGCEANSPFEPDPLPEDFELVAVAAVSGLTQPMYLTAPPNDPRLFIVEQPGRIRVVENGQLRATPYLDITSKVMSGGERGLLSVAFHPQYASNGHFYVNYTGASGATRIERYTVSANPNTADPQSAQLVLVVPQPFSNHNGGLVKFGPDGMLYIGMGDGGSGGDPQEHGQNRRTLLGALLRIDVDAVSPYAIPPDNPYAADPNAQPEIWAIGLRNPWRFSFDREGGRLYLADVGQNRREEINAVASTEAGLNYGWNTMEGSRCFDPPTGCDQSGLVLPVLDYPNPDEGCSVTGGYVYRGAAIPALRGHYFHGDYCRGTVRSFRLSAAGSVTDERDWSLGSLGNITSFGEDAAGELYVVVHQGTVFRLEES